MLVCVPEVLSRDEIDRILGFVASGEFEDGRATAGSRARRVKHNLQLRKGRDEAETINGLVREALRRHPVVRAAVMPRRIQPPLISRYEAGMQYGRHVDDAIMGKTEPMRADVACTVFLSDPADYDGGELVVGTSYGEEEVKLLPGEAVVYPASTLHRVAAVTRGVRVAAVTWIQSYVRDPSARELLYDLSRVRDRLAKLDPEGDETDLAFKTHSNLLRRWAEL